MQYIETKLCDLRTTRMFFAHEGYGITELRNDVEKSNQNIVFPFSQILDMYYLEKRWGIELKVKTNIENSRKITTLQS